MDRDQLVLFNVPLRPQAVADKPAALKAWETLLDAASGTGAPTTWKEARRLVWRCERFKHAEAVLAALVQTSPGEALKADTERHMGAWKALRSAIERFDDGATHVLAYGHTARAVERIGADCAAVLNAAHDLCMESLEDRLRLKVAQAAEIAVSLKMQLKTHRRAA